MAKAVVVLLVVQERTEKENERVQADEGAVGSTRHHEHRGGRELCETKQGS